MTRRFAPKVNTIDDAPAYLFGELYVTGVSPDYRPENAMQRGNTLPATKIQPKRPWEIASSYFGVPARLIDGGFMSRYSFVSPQGRYNYNWPLNLIDGNSDTWWASIPEPPYEQSADKGPITIRIDLPFETGIYKLDMVTVAQGLGFGEAWKAEQWGFSKEDEYGNPLPRKFSILVSRDGKHWETVYHTDNLPAARENETLTFEFKGLVAKQILLRGEDFGPMTGKNAGLFGGNCWQLAQVRVYDWLSQNVALASRGTGITVDTGPQGQWDFDVLNDVALACRYDLGVKWIRANYWSSSLEWHYVEQEKGEYVIDPVAEQAVTECAENGVNLIMGLMYGNWLYAEPSRPNLRLPVDPLLYDSPPVPVTPEQIEAYLNYVRFMVHRFKDRVTYWEIWNEPSVERLRYGFGNDLDGARLYANVIKAAAPVIKSIQPEAKVVISNNYWAWDVFKEAFAEVAPLVDALEPAVRIYELSMNDPDFFTLPQKLTAIRDELGEIGFIGEIMMMENQWFAEPQPLETSMFGYRNKVTFLQQAKNMARLMMTGAGEDVMIVWQGGFQMESGTLAPAYYALRTLCTVMDGMHPVEMPVELRCSSQVVHYTFAHADGSRLLACWLPTEPAEVHCGVALEVALPGVVVGSVTGIDVMNGIEQPLTINMHDGVACVSDLLVRDYPLVLIIKA